MPLPFLNIKMPVVCSKVVVICAVASTSALLAFAGLWFYRRRRRTSSQSGKGRVVATVDKLWVYPMKAAYRVDVDEIECTKRGFKHDRYGKLRNSVTLVHR